MTTTDHTQTPLVDPAFVQAMPKVELHVHLEGTMPAEAIAELAATVGEPLPRPVDELFSADGLSDFLAFLDWSCGLVRTAELAAHVAYEHARRSAADGIVYAEVIVNPTHWPNLSLDELVAGITAGYERAAADGLADCHLLLSILRTQSAAEAEALVDWMIATRPPRVLGLSIDGNEARAGRTGERFQAAYQRAGEADFGLVAHAGESSGPDGVRDALDLLGVDRIDHGVRSVEDPAVLERVVAERIPLDVCLTSNSYLLYPDLASHPLPELVAAGAVVTINTDDPAFLGCDLTGELLLAAELLGWGHADLIAVTRAAIDASFATPERRTELHTRLDEFHLADTEPGS